MAGIRIITNVDRERALQSAKAAARDAGYTVHPADDWTFQAQKGNLPLSIVLGAFVAYCNFRVLADKGRDGTTEIIIERNSPWWTGAIGVSRVQSRAKELGDEIASALEEQGGRVLRKEAF